MITYLTRLPWRVFRGGIVMTVLGTFYTVRSVPRWPRKLTSAVRAVEPWGILIAVIALVMTAIDFEEDRTARAWQLLASDAPGNSGKIWALEYLGRARHCLDWVPGFGLLPEDWQDAMSDRECLPREPLIGIDLSPRDGDFPTYLIGVRLEGAMLSQANLTSAELSRANLANARLHRADLSGADLEQADLSGADLEQADLSGADLEQADLSGADLWAANLSGARLVGTDLSGAEMGFADLVGARLQSALISNASLSRANLSLATGRTYGDPDLSRGPPIQCRGSLARVELDPLLPPEIEIVECDDGLNPIIGPDGNYIYEPVESDD